MNKKFLATMLIAFAIIAGAAPVRRGRAPASNEARPPAIHFTPGSADMTRWWP